MDRYQRVEKPMAESPIQENEIRITANGLVKNYVSYGISLIQDKLVKEITLKAMGHAISKAVQAVEILKKQFPKLHQDTAISSMSLTDLWEPIEEGLLPVETTRQVSMIMITLSTKELNKTSPGYQAPNHAEESQQPRQPRAAYNAGYVDYYGQGRERGRGRGRGWSRGRGYGDYYQDNHGYSNNWGQGHLGRGRNFYQGDSYNRIAYDQGYEQGHGRGYDQSRGGYGQGRRGGDYDGGRGGGYDGGRGGDYDRGQGDGYERGQRGGYERGQGGGYERGRGRRGNYEQGQGSGYEGGQGGEYDRGRRGYARGRGYEQGQGGGYEEGQGAGYERGRGGYGRGRGRVGGRSRSGGF